MELKDRIAKAKTALILNHPFFGALAVRLQTIITDEVPTAATNGRYIKYNPNFCTKLSDDNLVFLVAHECMHPMLDHLQRLNGRDPRKWNMAGDYVINQHLVQDGIGKFIDGGLLDSAIFQAGDGNTVGIYNILPDSDGGGGGKGKGGGKGDYGIGDDIEEPASDAEAAEIAVETKVAVAQAAQAARMQGKLSASIERLVGEALKPKVDWRDVLQQFVVRVKDDSRTFARPNRRFISQGLYLPTQTGEALGDIVFAVDMSGSIRDDEVAQFLTEVRTVHEDLKPSKLHVVYFSHHVTGHDEFEPDDMFNATPRGNGGTAFSPVFRHIADAGIEPAACVFLTDLECSDFGPEPDYPVLWVTTYATNAPFGEVVEMK